MSHSRGMSPDEDFWPYRHLAIRVVMRALLDVMSSDGAGADRESARVFLNGSGMLFHWCHVAALDPHVIARLAEKLGGARAPFAQRSSGFDRLVGTEKRRDAPQGVRRSVH